MSIVYTNNLDMHSGGVPLIVHLGQYDSDFSLVFNLYSSVGALTIESGTTAEIRGTKSDGFGYSADATIDIVNKKVTVAGSNQMTAAARQNIFELVLLKNNKVLSSANFILDIEHAALDADTIQDESVLKELNAIIEGAATATQAAESAAADASDASDYADTAEAAALEALASNFSVDVRTALLTCFDHVAWADEHGQEYYDALEAAMNPQIVNSISAVFTQGQHVVYNTENLDTLRDYLVVTATYSDASTEVVSGYTLSGTLTKGTSTITVAYAGRTTTFNVTVSNGYRIPGSKLKIQTNQNQSPYYNTINKRLSYSDFDLLLEGGKTYRIEVDSDVATANIGFQCYNLNVLNAVANQSDIASANIYDPGWQSFPYNLSAPATINNSTFAGMRFTFRKDSSDSAISTNFVNEVRITEV